MSQSILERVAALQGKSAHGKASSPEGGQGKVLHAGWLYKTGAFGSKNKRFCVLYDDPQLSWFDDEGKTKYKGGCSLQGASVSIDGDFLDIAAVGGVGTAVGFVGAAVGSVGAAVGEVGAAVDEVGSPPAGDTSQQMGREPVPPQQH